MPLQGEYEPSPSQWAADQVSTYERSGGTEGNTMQSVPVIILHTRGRHSGKARKAPLMRVEHDGTYAAIASLGGAPTHPVWYLNLVADPHVAVQDGPDVVDHQARVASGAERDAWWARAVEVWPDYASYQKKTERVIPVVLLDRTGD